MEATALCQPRRVSPGHVRLGRSCRAERANPATRHALRLPTGRQLHASRCDRNRDARPRDTPAPGLYNICYINGFQTQTDEEAWWLSLYPDLILRDSGGNPVRDPNWDELLFDVSTANKRSRLASIVGTWIVDCAAKGFAAVDIDNLDSFTRSGGRLNADHAVAYMALLSSRAHARGLAVSQKNAPELLPRKAEMGTDFAVVESCDCWQECGVYTSAYCSVLAVEYPSSECPSGDYDSNSFLAGCNRYPQLARLYRDVALSTPGSAGYLYLTCPALPQVEPRCQSTPVPALPSRWLFANVALMALLVARAGYRRGRRRRC